MMNKIIFDLNEYGIEFNDLKILLNRCNNDIMINGFVLRWDYELKDNIVEVTARLENIKYGGFKSE